MNHIQKKNFIVSKNFVIVQKNCAKDYMHHTLTTIKNVKECMICTLD